MRSLPLIALTGVAFVAGTTAAVGQDQMLPATGVYNCPIETMSRCIDGKCETRTPPKGMEVSIDFSNNSACIRRGGDCRKPRAFTVSARGKSHLLIFAKEGMVFRLRPNGHLTGADLSSRGAVAVTARCARG